MGYDDHDFATRHLYWLGLEYFASTPVNGLGQALPRKHSVTVRNRWRFTWERVQR